MDDRSVSLHSVDRCSMSMNYVDDDDDDDDDYRLAMMSNDCLTVILMLNRIVEISLTLIWLTMKRIVVVEHHDVTITDDQDRLAKHHAF